MMTRSQLAANARAPRTPSRRLPTTRRGPVASPVMFHHEDNPYTTHRTIAIVNVTSTSQRPEVTIAGLRGNQYFLNDSTINVENIDVREYCSYSEGEYTITAEWRAHVES